jgi:hypothetical protein
LMSRSFSVRSLRFMVVLLKDCVCVSAAQAAGSLMMAGSGSEGRTTGT